MSHLVLFEHKQVRRVWHGEAWWFVIVDIVAALTDSANPADYLKKLRKRDPLLGEAFKGGGTNCPPLALLFETAGGPQKLLCWSTPGILRLIQSIPSPKAEPFKRWLAQVGYERLQEIENPELAARRMKEIYRQKGYSEAWIEKRMRGIAVRDELTDEWKKRGVKADKEYAILTAEISKATFGMTPSEYREHKALERPTDNLRAHMSEAELIFTALAELSTRQIAESVAATGMVENKVAAKTGGRIAKNARLALEAKTGGKVVTGENYLPPAKTAKKVK
ncbi:MAG: Bro-N domain-containing protein [Opitutus sp.]|nr:Bro-N domain-containing protein [Opitutus sp.]MCS6247675.1 Bro-N domain-containing protein [Opitutus sp.]MCS6273903.1 Bro-N domain-containing protein [Opitutus sp.]MCS6276271.1 Bro-N domain-containing protein [Opitutus sp.]MCS6301365.1 Bro-N domain-containing protein [Opitutus sp.]